MGKREFPDPRPDNRWGNAVGGAFAGMFLAIVALVILGVPSVGRAWILVGVLTLAGAILGFAITSKVQK